MWRYDILVLGILLILSIFDFALAAPALVQEKRQAVVDVLQMPKDLITVLGKRVGEESDKLGKLAEEYFETSKNPVESSDAHTSSSSALPVPGHDHGSMNDVQEPYPASSTTANDANLDTLMEPSSPSSTHAMWQDGSGYEADDDMPGPMHESEHSDGEVLGPMHNPQSTNYGSGHGLTGKHGLQPNPNPKLSDPGINWDHWQNLGGDGSPLKRPKLGQEAYEGHWLDLEDNVSPLKRPKLGQTYEDQVAHMQRPNTGTSNMGSSSPILPTEPGHRVVTAPSSPSLGLPMELDDE